jgi:adenylate cyclase
MRSWWDSLNYLPPIERFREFIVESLLKEIEQHIVIFIDEIDTVLSLDFPMDDFFALIRSFYNSRGDYPGYERLSFVLLGVATPSSLIQDKLRTPFNIGRAIALSGFKLHEVKPLILGFASRCSEPEHVMREVLSWTGGQPFLTQRLCELITKSQVNIEAGKEAELIETLVESEIIQDWSEKDTLDHFKTIENRLTKNQLNPVHLLELYQKIWIQGELDIKDSQERRELLLSGLVYLSGGKLKIYNPIYQRIFNNTWIEDTLDEVNLKFQNKTMLF